MSFRLQYNKGELIFVFVYLVVIPKCVRITYNSVLLFTIIVKCCVEKPIHIEIKTVSLALWPIKLFQVWLFCANSQQETLSQIL